MAVSGIAGKWREGLQDPLIQEILAFAREKHLNLSVRRVLMNPWDVQVEELVDPTHVNRIARVLKESGEWPEDMPLSVITAGETSWVMDGSHRTTAARVAKYRFIPVLVADPNAYFEISTKFKIPMFDYVHSILPAFDSLMAENERKDEEGGRAKRRTAEAWDMEAFESPELGALRRGPKGTRGAPPGHLYHSTFADRIWNIARLGLLPSENPRWSGKLGKWSVGKIFFSGHVSAAAFYAAVHFSKKLLDQGESPDPILLRVDSKNLRDVERDTFSADDWFIEHSIPPDQIEVWIPWSRRWAPIKEVSREVSRMETVRGEPGDLPVDPEANIHVYTETYFKKFWPMDE
jgi:hypothetical protein